MHSGGQYLVAVGEDTEWEDAEEEDGKLLSISGKCSNLGSGSTFPQEKTKLIAGENEKEDEEKDDDDGDDDDGEHDNDEEAEERAPVKKSIWDTPAKNESQNERDSKPLTPKSKGPMSFKKTGRSSPNTQRT